MVQTNPASLDAFAPIKDAYDGIEGMTGLVSAQLFHILLNRQDGVVTGPMLEIGAYKGRSAIVLAHHLRKDEHLDLVDVHPYLETAAFAQFGDRVRLHIGSSDDLQKVLPGFSSNQGRYRFIHSDASHTFTNVVNDMRRADGLLHPLGVLSVDDYENPNYPQVPLAVGAALYGEGVKLAPFLVANNKLYLCRPQQLRALLAFTVNEIAPVLYREHGFMIARTDMDERAPLALRPASPGEEGQVYGASLFGGMVDALRPSASA